MTTVKRYYLAHANFRAIRQIFQSRSIYFMAGTNSIFVPSRQEKYVQLTRADGSPVCKEWENSDGEKVLMTPSEAAREELKKTFPGLRRVGWQQDHIRLFDWRWPMLFTGTYTGYGSYIDLKGAYHQLYRRLWLDTAFPCGYGSLSLHCVADALKDWKAARNSIVGICAARQAVGVKGFLSVYLKTKNSYLSPGLWATIQAILNEIAFQAEQCGAIYIATDGYIFPKREQADLFEEILTDHGLNYRRLDGKAEIKRWGCYKVGEKSAGASSWGSNHHGQGFRAIRLFDTDYPNRLLRWWSKSIPQYATTRWQEIRKEQ